MIIDDPEGFKTWLTATLEPRCDADPAALAKYVLALVRKDKPLPELRVCMVEQLDVFLQQETKSFVELLFQTLETQVYGATAKVEPKVDPAPPATPPPQPVLPDPSATKLPELFPTQPPTQPSVAEQAVALPAAYQGTNGVAGHGVRTQRKGDAESDKEKVASRGRSRASPGRARSRSRSWDRSRRPGSREREPRRERDRSRPWRNKSPPRRQYERGERRRSWSKSPTGRQHSRSRSPRFNNHRGRYRNRSPPRGSPGSRSRSRSPLGTTERSKPVSGGGTPTQDSNHGDVDMRLTTTSQSIQSVVCSKPPPVAQHKRRCRDFDEKGYCMRGDLCPFDHGNDPVVLEDVALSSVLTFGPAAHPPPAQQPPAPQQPPPPGNGDRGPPQQQQRPPMHHVGHAMGPHHHHMRGPPPQHNMEYNPDAPGMMWSGRPQYRGGGPMRGGPRGGQHHRPMPYPMMPSQRELISVPVMGQHGNDGYAMQPRESKDALMKKRMNVDVFGRLGPRHKNPQNCSLELKKVPRGLNNITHLNNHFNKFGKIVNIQVSVDGDPEAAIVTFSSHAEANAAYKSTEAVLNNRFIKVFWHHGLLNEVQQVQENVPPSRMSVKERLGAPPTSHALQELGPKMDNEPVDKVVMSGSVLTKTLYIPTAMKKEMPALPTPQETAANKASSLAAIKNSQDILEATVTLKKMQMEKQKEAIKLCVNLRKRKQELLAKQLGQQRLLIARLEKLDAGEQRDKLMATIKSLQESIETIKKETANQMPGKSNAALLLAGKAAALLRAKQTQQLAKKTREEAQREILDLELDLFAKQQEGGDTSELRLKVAELKMEAQAMPGGGLTMGVVRAPRGRAMRMRGSYRGGRSATTYVPGAHVAGAHSSVDHRPTKVLVSGYENDDKAEVMEHFKQYGAIVDVMCDDATPSVILNYKSRKEAETALLKGRTFQDRLLSVTWCNQPGQRNTRHVLSTTLVHRVVPREEEEGARMAGEEEEGLEEEEDETITAFNEDALLQDDEEEEEEDDEDKTWRR